MIYSLQCRHFLISLEFWLNWFWYAIIHGRWVQSLPHSILWQCRENWDQNKCIVPVRVVSIKFFGTWSFWFDRNQDVVRGRWTNPSTPFVDVWRGTSGSLATSGNVKLSKSREFFLPPQISIKLFIFKITNHLGGMVYCILIKKGPAYFYKSLWPSQTKHIFSIIVLSVSQNAHT